MTDKPAPALPMIGHAPDADAIFALAESALTLMPAALAVHASGLLLCIEDIADDATLDAMEIDHPFDLTGLYHGRPMTEKSLGDGGDMPDRITLYRLPILAEWAESGERLDWLVRHIMVHEIGHHFGFSDDDMAAIEAGE